MGSTIVKVDVGDCIEVFPCQHDVTITYGNGDTKTTTCNCKEILDWYGAYIKDEKILTHITQEAKYVE